MEGGPASPRMLQGRIEQEKLNLHASRKSTERVSVSVTVKQDGMIYNFAEVDANESNKTGWQ